VFILRMSVNKTGYRSYRFIVARRASAEHFSSPMKKWICRTLLYKLYAEVSLANIFLMLTDH
jgi:hypothetical protein